MATYLRGITDQVNVINPPQINHQFEMQLLQQRQSKYDQAHARINQMYSTILNSPLTRTDNKEARDEFFKIIENDIKKIAQSDLSLENNARMAEGLFAQIYQNDFLVKDMVWTKNYNMQRNKAEMFKNCLKESDCGGLYWEEGVKYMEYQRDRFLTADRNEAMNVADAEYVPYYNITEAAIKHAKDADLNVTIDQLTGKYIVTTKNGPLVTDALETLFTNLFADNYNYQKMYEVRSSNFRNDWMRGAVADGKYETLNEARVGFIKENYEQKMSQIQTAATQANVRLDNIDTIITAYDKTIAEGNQLTPDEIASYNNYRQAKKALESINGYREDIIKGNAILEGQENTQSKLEKLLSNYDKMNSLNLFEADINSMAENLAHKDYSVTMKADEFAKLDQKHIYDMVLQRERLANNLEVARIRAEGSSKGGANLMSVEITGVEAVNQKHNNLNEEVYILEKVNEATQGVWSSLDAINQSNNSAAKKALERVQRQIQIEQQTLETQAKKQAMAIAENINKDQYRQLDYSNENLTKLAKQLQFINETDRYEISKEFEVLTPEQYLIFDPILVPEKYNK